MAGSTSEPWHRFYAPGVPHKLNIPNVSVSGLLDEAAARHGRRTALVFFGKRTSYRALQRAVARFAAGLAALGVARGDRVALVMPNCPQYVVAFYGALKLGAVVVPTNPLYTESELAHQLKDSGAVVAVVHDGVFARVDAVRGRTALRHIVVASLLDALPARSRLALRLPLARSRDLRAKLRTELPQGADQVPFATVAGTRVPRQRKGEPQRAQGPVSPRSAVAVLQYTGGTTGTPKGAMLTHRNLVANAHQVRAWYPQLRAGRETLLACLPMFHVYGMTMCLGVAAAAGARTVLLPTFEPELVVRTLRRWKPTLFPGVPPMYQALMARAEQHGPELTRALRSVRYCISGAMRLEPETVDRFQELTGGHLVEGYGLSEASPVVLANPLNANARPGTVGVPLPGTEVRIVAEDDPAKQQPFGVAGELVVRGPQVFGGYWHEREDSAAMLHDHWLFTGDIAVMSPDGFVTVIDRKRDVIIASGFSIFPSEVEEVLLAHPAVADAAVVGVPDEYRGETVKACVIVRTGSRLTERALIEYCAARLTGYKVPKIVEFRSDALPRNMLGKVLRRVLRDEHLAAQIWADEPSG
ncbi:AMP-binding protein [Streptacidiphilus fuscans]|uniref:AMP-binding protein n=1 Tax=Streptacidiphilus fuscans TaxID=2789292 RepID=A0A931B985_9ACTN|nr:AMP-binding protein [Streptacidiphilus fuscans]MBF9070103.1 AMP-binding protein [Streptacidiphilus fuscans]